MIIDENQSLSLIPNWKENQIALVDGNRLLLFNQDLDNSYWLNENSLSSNFPLVSGSDNRFRPELFNRRQRVC